MAGIKIGSAAMIEIGYAGENKTREIIFDAKEWMERLPGCEPAIVGVRADGVEFTAPDVRKDEEEKTIIWTLTDGETIAGEGEAQLLWMDGERVAKRAIVVTMCRASLETEATVPGAPEPIWGRQAVEAMQRAEEAAAKAETAEGKVNAAEQKALEAIEEAEAAAMAEIDEKAEKAAMAAEEQREAAEDAAKRAEEAANAANEAADRAKKNVTTESIESALGYMPAKQEDVDSLSEEIADLSELLGITDITNIFDFGWTNGYIHSDGVYRPSNNYQYSTNSLFLNKGDVIFIKTKGYEDKVAIVSEVLDLITPTVISVDSNLREYVYKAEKYMGVRLSRSVSDFSISVYRASTNILSGKTILNYGDSIGRGAGNNNIGYAELIAEKYGMNIINRAVSGATFRTGTDRSHISARIINDSGYKPNYVLIEGGFNDLGHQKEGWLGSLSESYNVSALSATNLYGALEKSFDSVRAKYPLAKSIYVITPKILTTYYPNWDGVADDKFNTIRKAIIECCEKWSVKYVDLFTLSAFNSVFETYFNMTSNGNGEPDGVHPNKECYEEFYVPFIESAMLSM